MFAVSLFYCFSTKFTSYLQIKCAVSCSLIPHLKTNVPPLPSELPSVKSLQRASRPHFLQTQINAQSCVLPGSQLADCCCDLIVVHTTGFKCHSALSLRPPAATVRICGQIPKTSGSLPHRRSDVVPFRRKCDGNESA